ncbi:SRPBCC family protein [Brevibacillus sp. HB2.2]|uniref:SRPBCC family protein n=1 Tax=Brevibacillus sp. HB2.2 TaxID=2738846 RepID=UPI00156BA840|nr:SRPBCC family protein [Brevibacillus sp. HB2.2]NRS51399.1 SRPBCC family protein [Brevibacillus sp. HB2.2]
MDLRFDFYIGATPELVWHTLTSDEGVKSTFFGCTIRSTFQVGDEMAYVGPGKAGDDTVHVYGEILQFEPHHIFSFTEHPGPAYYENHAELQSRVTITLEPVGGCTKLTLIQDQWTENHPSHASASNNWPMMLSSIKTYAETGKTLDFGF